MATRFENAETHNGIHYTRYIASWKRMGGKIFYGGLFERWLKEVQKLTDEEINDILFIATNGKMELEMSAKVFMKANKEEFSKENEMEEF